MKIKTVWEINADIVSDVYGGHVDWDERVYDCPKCDWPIYESDWTQEELERHICPVCEFTEDEDE